jgi:hypothetical protein
MGRRQRDPEGTRIRGGAVVTFEEVLTQTIAMLQRLGRVSYRALKRQFALDDAFLEDLKYELTEIQHLAVDHDGTMLVWTGDASTATAPVPSPATSAAMPPPTMRQAREPLAYTPPYLTEKILMSRSALAGERKQVTVLFADLKGSMELLADRDPEEARQLLNPVLERMRITLYGPAMLRWPFRMRSAATATKCAAHMASRCRSGSALTPGRSWCGPSATICTWTTRPLARPPTWRPAWNSSHLPGAFG